MLINQKYAQITELKLYLDSTDYHNQKREDDRQKGIDPLHQTPVEVLMQRDEARDSINILEDEISVLERELLEEKLSIELQTAEIIEET